MKVLGFLLMPALMLGQVYNGSFEIYNPSNANLADGWQVYGNAYSRLCDIPDVWGLQCIAQMTSGAGAVQRVTLNQSIAKPVLMTVRVKVSGVPSGSTDGAYLDCKISFHDGTFGWCPASSFKVKMVDTFGEYSLLGFNTKNLTASSAPIDWIEMRLRMGAVSSGTAWFDDAEVVEYSLPASGMVTFRFDDSFKSHHDKALPLLNSYGFVGTEAAVWNYIGKDSFHMTLADHKDLFVNKWSIISHTLTHRDLSTLSLDDLNTELYWSQKYLVDAGFPVVHLATPFGGYNGQVLSRAQAEWYGNYPYLSITNTDNDVNSQGVYPYNTYVQAIKSTTTLANVQGWLANARDKKAWLILLIHEVDNPYNDPYNVDFATFQNMVDVVRQSGLPVVTYDEGFNRITAKQ